jgi:hypothetical protein
MNLAPYAFWAGYFCAVLPTLSLALRRETLESDRTALMIGLAVFSLIPKLVRTGFTPTFFDEFNHLRLAQDIVRTGRPIGHIGLLQVGGTFPGLEYATTAMYRVSSGSLIVVGEILVMIAHMAGLFGVFALARELTKSSRAGVVASAVFLVNPSWLFFDAQYSYETLSIPIAIWILFFSLRAMSLDRESNRLFNRETFIAIILIGGLVIIHHATTAFVAGMLGIISLVATLQLRHRQVRISVAWLLTAVSVVVAASRFYFVRALLETYLGPAVNLSAAFHRLLSFVGLSQSPPIRAAFAGADLTSFEVVCAFAMPIIMFIAFVAGVWGVAPRWRSLHPAVWAFGILGATFLLSLPLDTIAKYAESIHRLWGFSFIGLAVFLAYAYSLHETGQLNLRIRKWNIWPRPHLARRIMVSVSVVAFIVVGIGGVALGTVNYRFGGPVIAAQDARFEGTQTALIANWFAKNTTSHDSVFADRYVSRTIVVRSTINYPPPAYSWGLSFDPVVTNGLIRQIYRHHITYIVVDRRMSSGRTPPQGFWYARTEPKRYHLLSFTTPRYACIAWLAPVFATSDYEVFRVNPVSLRFHMYHFVDSVSASCAASILRGKSQ